MADGAPSLFQTALVVVAFAIPAGVLALAAGWVRVSPGRALVLGLALTVAWPFFAGPGYDDLSDTYRNMMLAPVLLMPFLLWACLHKLVSRMPWTTRWPMHLVVASPFLAVLGLLLAFLFSDWKHY